MLDLRNPEFTSNNGFKINNIWRTTNEIRHTKQLKQDWINPVWIVSKLLRCSSHRGHVDIYCSCKIFGARDFYF